MGRFYSGNISGKFWVAVQSSGDGAEFGGMMCEFDCKYLGCDECQYDGESNYCRNCFSSYKEHLDYLVDNGDVDEDDKEEYINEEKELYEEDNNYEMRFEGGQLVEVEGHIKILEEKIGHLIKDFTMKDETDGYEYEMDYEYPPFKECSKDNKELIARYCLARQVAICLKEKGECSFDCEC